MKLAIVIQGPSSNIDELKKAWDGYDIIWSTWVGEESKYSKNDIVVYNSIPSDSGICNISLQKETTLNGIEKAKSLGYDRILKWRSDLIPNNPKKLLELFVEDKLNFLAWHNDGKYFIDYFMEGNIDDINKMWDFEEIHGPFPEKLITDNIFKKGLNNFNFICCDLNEDNDIYWVKRNTYLSSYKNHTVYNNENNIINND